MNPIANIYKAAPGVHLLRIEPGGKAPLKGTQWRDNPLTAAEAVDWTAKGERLGIVPASVRCGVLDLDHGGQPMLDAVKAKFGAPIDFLPSSSAEPGGEPRGHIVYPTDTPTGNGKWAGGDLRVDAGYVVIKDPDGLKRWADAAGISIHRQPPSVDLNEAKHIRLQAAGFFAQPFDPAAQERTEPGFAADSSIDPMPVPAEPVNELRKVVLRTIRRAAREASSPADLEARGRRIVTWFGGCRKRQEEAGWNLTEEMRRFDEDRDGFMRDVAKHSAERFGTGAPTDKLKLTAKKHLGIKQAIELGLGIQIRWHTRARTFEFRCPAEAEHADWAPLEDRDYDRMCSRIYDRCLRQTGPKTEDVEPVHIGRDALINQVAIAWSEYRYESDPFADYLRKCRASAPSSALDSWMIEAGFDITNADTDFVRWVCRYFFLAAVQRTLDPGCELEEIPLLIGARGSGKSSACGWVFPKPMRDSDMFNEGFWTTPDTKTMMEVTEGSVINEWQELKGVDKVSPGDLKNYLSRRKDKARPSYGRKPVTIPRWFVIIGTTNKPDIPNDPALKRRFVAVYIKSGDVGRIRAYLDEHRESLWSAALHAYDRGERANLPHRMVDAVDANNEGSVKVDIHLREVILGVLRRMGYPKFFSKHDFCAGANHFLTTDALGQSHLMDAPIQARTRDAFWRREGEAYADALFEIGYRQTKHPKRGFDLYDEFALDIAKSDGTYQGGGRHPPGGVLAGSGHPQTPILAGHDSIIDNHRGVTDKGGDGGEEGHTLSHPRYPAGPAHEGYDPAQAGRVGHPFDPPDDLDGEPEP